MGGMIFRIIRFSLNYFAVGLAGDVRA